MDFILPALPYSEDALEPVISKRTLNIHHQKHHGGYLAKLDILLSGDERNHSIEKIVHSSYMTAPRIFNLAAQIWNHAFYWNCLSPTGSGPLQGDLLETVKNWFGSLETLKKVLREEALGTFGSGWVWLVYDPKHTSLEVVSTGNAGCPLVDGKAPLLNIDLWEHSYYLDYQNRRADYIDGVIHKLLNWKFAASNLRRATDAQRSAGSAETGDGKSVGR